MENRRLGLLAVGIASLVAGAAIIRHFATRDALVSVFDPTDRSNRVAHDFLDDVARALVLTDTTSIEFGSESARSHYVEPDPRLSSKSSGILSRAFGNGMSAGFACGNEVSFRIVVLEPQDRRVALEGLGLDDSGAPQRLEIGLVDADKRTPLMTTEWPRSDAPKRTEFILPKDALRPGENTITVRFARTIEREFQGLPGKYALAAVFTKFEFVGSEAKSAPAQESSEHRKPDLRGTVVLDEVIPPGGGAPKRALAFARGDRLVLPVILPQGRPRFVASLFVHPDDADATNPPRVRVRYRSGNGGKLLIAQGELDASAQDPRRRTSLELDADLSAFSDTEGTLEIESERTDSSAPLVRLALAGPLIRGGRDLPIEPPARPELAASIREKLGRPNVVVFLLDAASARHFTAYGADREYAPTVDTLALGGCVFEGMTSPASYTLPSVGSLFTGLLPDRHGVIESGAEGHKRLLAESVETLAQKLSREGYSTEAWITNPNAGKDPGYDRGFKRYDALYADPKLWNEGVTPEAVVEHAEQRLAEGGLTEPFLLYAHLFPPHAPYRAPARFREGLTDPRYSGPADGSRDSIEAYRRQGKDYLPRDLDELKALYRANLRYSDDGVRNVLDALGKAGKLDRTLIVVLADHGEAFGEHRNLEHGDTTFGEEIEVPFILHVPRTVGWQPTRVRGPASIVDVAPTLLSLLGVRFAPTDFDGSDLTGRIGNSSPTTYSPGPTVSRSLGQQPRYVIRSRSFAYHEDTFTRQRWLFDLRVDPHEERPIRCEDSPLAEALRGQLCEILCRRPAAVGETVALTPEQIKMAQEIGYLEGFDRSTPAKRKNCLLDRR